MAEADITSLKVPEAGYSDYLSALLLPEEINEVFLPESLQITGKLYSQRGLSPVKKSGNFYRAFAGPMASLLLLISVDGLK